MFICGICQNGYTPVLLGNKKQCLKYLGKLKHLIEPWKTPFVKTREMCSKDGASLPLPQSDQENTDLYNFFVTERAKLTKNKQLDNLALDLRYFKKTGSFMSSTGDKPVFAKWGAGEPGNNTETNQYVALTANKTWGVYGPNFFVATICQQKICLSALGKVKKCTLLNALSITAQSGSDKRTYCAKSFGKMPHSKGKAHCKSLYAKLPLPKSSQEVNEFNKTFPTLTEYWIDLTDPSKSKDKAKWRDSDGKQPVYIKTGLMSFINNRLL